MNPVVENASNIPQTNPAWPRNLSNLARVAIIIAVAFPFAVAFVRFILIGCYSRMFQDDYDMVPLSGGYSTWQMVASRYETWTGRYSWTALEDILLRLFGFHATQVAAVVLLILWTVAFFSLYRAWLPRAWSIVLALATIDTLITACPEPVVFYWFSANSGYLPPIIIAIFLIPRLLLQTKAVKYELAFLGISAFAAAGFNEMSSVALVFLSASWLAFTKGKNWRILTVTIALGVGFIVMFIAPGNHVRKAGEGTKYLKPQAILNITYRSVGELLNDMCPRSNIYFPSMLDLPTIDISSKHRCVGYLYILLLVSVLVNRSKVNVRSMLVAAIVLLAALFLSITICVYGMGRAPYDRMMLEPILICIGIGACAASIIAVCLRKISCRLNSRIRIAVALLCLPIIYSNAYCINIVSRDALLSSKQTAMEWDTQDAAIRLGAAAHQSDIKDLPPVEFWDTEGGSIGPNPRSYSNVAAARVYRVHSLSSR